MIQWVGKKIINCENISQKIEECVQSKHFTNNGKNVKELQDKLKETFQIEETKEVSMVCNGAMGLNALALAYCMFYNKKLKWAVQSFTFPCSVQGAFIDSIIMDIDENMGPNIIDLEKEKNNYDGILVTNCFGSCSNIQLYEDFCKKNNKVLLFDNAASSFSMYKNKNLLNYGNGCMVSLHHTKPIGFGEGGFIVYNKNLKDIVEKVICFGYSSTNKYEFSSYANNFKMSEIAAIYISDFLTQFTNIKDHNFRIIQYFLNRLKRNSIETKVKLFKNYTDYSQCLLSTIPIVFPNPVDLGVFHKHNIEAKKYYYPLNSSKKANDIFKNIICLPLNMDVNENEIDQYIEIILSEALV